MTALAPQHWSRRPRGGPYRGVFTRRYWRAKTPAATIVVMTNPDAGRFDELARATRDAFAAGNDTAARSLYSQLHVELLHELVGRRVRAQFMRNNMGDWISRYEDDATQDVFAAIYRQLSLGKDVTYAMVGTICHRRVVDLLDRNVATNEAISAGVRRVNDDGQSLDVITATADPIDRVDELLQTMDAWYLVEDVRASGERNAERKAQILEHHLLGITNNAEIARLLDAADGTVRREWNEVAAWIRDNHSEARSSWLLADTAEDATVPDTDGGTA